MNNEREHPAEGPEQEITSDTPEFAEAMAERTIEPGDRPKATMPERETPLKDEEGESGDEAIGDEEPFAGREAPKLERLQKILAQAGIASRRHAEELITQGRVQVNGQTVTVLGSKADPQRDHIRVDGKLLHGAERQRYFVLNKPRGYVTTVKDPEGRPTVMEFFAKMGERLYPVGRLDYQSEGLLLVTNDGELANQLTRAASGVEKTYLVKVSGRPDEGQLERLRTGVAIDKGRPQEGKVHTAPAQIRQIRKGENPWFEVVLIEGRNRELRKMFEEIGHHVEKIRRVGYGPLVLDVEPGKIRELDTREVDALRLTAAGKLKPRRPKATYMLPKDAGKPAEERDAKPRRFGREAGGKTPGRRFERSDEQKAGSQPPFGSRPPHRFEKSDRSGRDRAAVGRPFNSQPSMSSGTRAERFGRKQESAAPQREAFRRPPQDKRGGDVRSRPFGDRTTGDRKTEGREDFRGRSGAPRKFVPNRPAGDRPRNDRAGNDRRFKDRPGRGSGDRREGFRRRDPNAAPRREQFQRPAPAKLRIEPASRPLEDRKPANPKAGGREDFRERSAPPRKFASNRPRPSAGEPSRGPRQDRGGERRERPTEFRGGRQGSPRREGTSPRPFRPESRSREGAGQRERPAPPFRGDRKPGSSFRGKPGPNSKPNGGAKRGPGGGKGSSPRPAGKRTFGGGAKRGPSRPGGKRPK